MSKPKYPTIYKLLYILVCCFLLFESNIAAREREPESVNFLNRVWTVEDGLPQNTIQTLLQTADGYLWIGTPSGLVRFDGVRFTTFTRWNLPALKNENITCLFEDQNDILWIGTQGGGLISYKDGIWKNYSIRDGLSSDFIKTIIEDWQGDLWVGTDYGLNRISDEGIEIFTTEHGLYDNIITSLAMDSWNNLWIGTFRGGLAKYHDKITEVFTYNQGLKNLSVHSLFADQNGFLWIGTLEGMYYIKRTESRVYPLSGTAHTPITCINSKEHDDLIVGTMVDGVKQIKEKQFFDYPGIDNLPDSYIRCLITDRDGNNWIGTDSGGLIQIKKQNIINISQKNGLPQQVVSAVLQDKKGVLWVGTRDKGLCKIKNNVVVRLFDKAWGLSSNNISVLFEDAEESIWVGTRDAGVNRIYHNRIEETFATSQGLLSDQITSILQDKQRYIWIGTGKGLNKLTKVGIQSIPFQQPEKNSQVNVLLENDKHTILAGTKQGVYQVEDNALVSLITDEKIGNYNAISLFEDNSGILWIGTKGSGIIRWCNGKIRRLTEDQGLHDNHIFSITEDKNHDLWMSSNSGIFRIRRRELDNFFSDSLDFVNPTYYDELDGMVSRQCIGEVQPSVWNSIANHLYYPTVKGLVDIDLETIKVESKAPTVIIEEILSDQDTISRSDNRVQIIYNDRVTIYFTGIDFNAAEKLRFQYKLEGLESEYTYLGPGKKRWVTYPHLSPGKYRFVINAANNEGNLNNQAAIFAFEVHPPLYMNPIFLLTMIVIGLSVSSYVMYYRHQQRIQKQLEKYKTLTLDPSIAEKTAEKLIYLMESEQKFLDPDLSLGSLSKELNIHYNHISRIINDKFGMSYNDFVNKYRIDEVRKRFSDEKYSNKTVLEIIYETGFYSKSVFNTAFKKFTGMTPTEYKKSILKDLQDQI